MKKPIFLTTNINHEARRKLKLTMNEYAVADLINNYQTNPSSDFFGWCLAYKKDIGAALGLTEQTVFSILNKLLVKGVIERHITSKHLRTTLKWYNNTIFSPTKDSLARLKNLTKEKVTPKENNINTLSLSEKGQSGKKPSCPLLNGSPLKQKYPKGHTECVEYICGIEEARGRKFINLKKQYQVLHNTLKAGYGFSELDKAIRAAEKKYGEWNFDLTTLAAFLEKGINGRT